MNTQTIKPGDIVRLTDPLDNGTIVRIENVDENGFAEWFGGSQYCDMEQIPCEFEAYPIGDNSLANYYETLSDVISDLESKIGVKFYPENTLNYYKQCAEKEAKEHIYYEKAWNKEHNKLLDAQDYIKKVCKESSDDIQKLDAENKKLKEELSRCRAANADYLTAKTEAENRAKLLKREITDLKVPDSRRERHLRDELHRSRLECQQAWEHANKEMAENKKLRESNEALKRQLDESNKQIEIYAQKVRNLEADLEEGGFNDERNFI